MVSTKIEALFWITIVLIISAAVIAYRYIDSQRPAAQQTFDICMHATRASPDDSGRLDKCSALALQFKERTNVPSKPAGAVPVK